MTPSILMCALFITNVGLAWDAETHPELNKLGVDLVAQWGVQENNEFYSEILSFRKQLADGGLDEDENTSAPGSIDSIPTHSSIFPDTTNCFEGLPHPLDPFGGPLYPRSRKHFYHPYAKVGLSDKIIKRSIDDGRCNNAVSWARDDEGEGLTWTGAVTTYGYEEFRKSGAYYYLGHVAHLVGDMSQPDHVHLEPHSLSGTPLADKGYWAGLDKYGHQNWDSGDRVKPSLNGLIPARYDKMEKYLTELALTTFDASKFQGVLRTNDPIATGELSDMFHVSYLLGNWTLSNEKIFGIGTGIIGNWDGNYSEDDEFYATNSLPQIPGYSESNFFFIETHDGANDEAVPASYKGQPNLSSCVGRNCEWTLQHIFADRLMPLGVEHIAGLYMHFLEVVNHPPILIGAQVSQGNTTVYDQSWEPNVEPFGRVVLGGQALSGGHCIAQITGRVLTSQGQTQWINGSGQAAYINLNFGGGYDASAAIPNPNDRCFVPDNPEGPFNGFPSPLLQCDEIVHTPCPDCKKIECPTTDSYTDAPKQMVDVMVSIGGINVIGSLNIDEDSWEGSFVPPLDGSLDGTHSLEVSGKDQAPHYTGYQDNDGELIERNYAGDELDTSPADLALTGVNDPYHWKEEYEPGLDMNHVLMIDATAPNIILVNEFIDKMGRTVLDFDVRDLTSGLESIKTTANNGTAVVDPFIVGTTDPVHITVTTNAGSISIVLNDVARNSLDLTFSVNQPKGGSFGFFELLILLSLVAYLQLCRTGNMNYRVRLFR